MTAENLKGKMEGKNSEVILTPTKELTTEDGYKWFTFDEQQTGMKLVALQNLETGLIVTAALANPSKRTAAHKAWAGARQSRSPGMPWEIMHEMGEKGVDPDQKLDEMFTGYGHASVGDMAPIQIDFANSPLHLAMTLFNQGYINSGQEKSTRYQRKFGTSTLHPLTNYIPGNLIDTNEGRLLESQYQDLGRYSIEQYNLLKDNTVREYTDFFNPDDKNELSALNTRALDSVRFLLLLGHNGGLSYETPARDWSRIISELKSSPNVFYRKTGDQIQRFLTPSMDEEQILEFRAEAPSLIRHAEASYAVNENLATLEKYIYETTDLLQVVPIETSSKGCVEQEVKMVPEIFTEGDRMVAQYLLTLWPGLQKERLMKWVHEFNSEGKKVISSIIMSGHNNYIELPSIAATTRQTIVIVGFLGEVRDLNRHRGMRRFLNIPTVYGNNVTSNTVEQILAKGYGLPIYISEIEEFSELRNDYKNALEGYYALLYKTFNFTKSEYGNNIDYAFFINLLPLAHQVDLWMHGDPKQFLYMPSQRVKPGGHANYIDLAWKTNQLVSSSDPYLSAMLMRDRPDPKNRSKFFDRS